MAELLALRPGLEVRVVSADLGTEAGRAVLLDWLAQDGRGVDLLVNNAGLGDYGSLAGSTPERLRALIEVNMTAVTMLCHALIPRLGARGGILNVSSLAGTLPMPDLAVYAASKAYVTSFSEALAVELEPLGMTVTCVCPGPTPTNFSRTARRPDGEDTNRDGQGLLRIPPAQVVAEALAGLAAGRACVYPGAGVRVAACLFRLMPRWLLRRILRRRAAKGRV